jgi:succinate dehydrogenase / fumarate reductase cytochrome b subunit
MPSQVKRPIHLNLFKIRLPIAGILSIMHRISGFFLALALPVLLYLFDLSLSGADGFKRAGELFQTLPVQLVFFLLLWGLMHHLLAGLRYLLLDVDIGIDKPHYRISAWVVIMLAPLCALLLLGGLS